MIATNEPESETANRELAMTHVFNAPQKLVFEAWTQPEHLKRWWGPTGFTTTTREADIRTGGVWSFIMHGPDGRDWTNKIKFDTVDPYSLLTYSHSDDDGALYFTVTVKFEEVEGDKTRLSMKSVFSSAEALQKVVRENGADKGMVEHLNRLGDQLSIMAPGMNIFPEDELTISRIFEAPLDLVYRAWTDPQHLNKWWGPAGMKMGVTNLDFKPGGMFLYSMATPDGHEMWGRFVYREIDSPKRIVFTNSFSDAQGNVTRAPFSPTWPLEVFNILTFTEYGDKTAVSLRGWPVNATEEERKTFNANKEGMNQGFKGTFDQLEAHLAEMVKG